MQITDLRELIARDLRQLCNEIDSFTDEADLWRTEGAVKNSAGNLCLHLCGNLRYFVGSVLGGGTYIRDREREFAAKGIPKAELLQEVDRTMAAVDAALTGLSAERLAHPFPVNVLPETTTTGHILLHLYGHLSYHLGQVNYIRRVLEK